MTSDRTSRWVTRLLVVVAFAAIGVALTWPLVLSPASRVPLGTEAVASVPLLNVWTVWWNADRAGHGFSDYWHAPIFYPARYAFAFSESQPTTLLVAPLVAVGGPILAYNAYLLAVLTLNGLAAYGLLKRVGLATVPAFLGGSMAECLPFVHWQLGVVQLATLCGVCWVIDRVVALHDEPKISNSALLGVAAAACYAACNYWGLYLSILIPLSAGALIWGRWLDGRFWGLLGMSGLIAAGLNSPIVWAQWQAKTAYEWKREEKLLFDLSAKPHDYATTPWRPTVPALDPTELKDRARPLWMLGPGVFKIGLAAAGVVVGLLQRGRRRWTLFLVLFGGWALLLSLGPRLEVVGWSQLHLRAKADDPAAGWVPYRLVTKLHPGLALARSPFRFALMVQIAAALLAANFLAGIWSGARWLATNWRPTPRRIGIGLASTATIAVGIFATAEVWPGRQRLYEPPPLDRPWIVWIRNNADAVRPVLDLPFPAGSTVEDYEGTALLMYAQMGHRRRMLQGYSGFFPDEFLALKEKVPSFPDDTLVDELYARGVRHVVATTPEWVAKLDPSSRLRAAFRDEATGVTIYEIQAAGEDRSGSEFEGPD